MTFTRREYGRGHAYFDPPTGKIPSVTAILGAGLPKPALPEWAARESAQYVLDHWQELVDQKPSDRYKAVLGARWESSRRAMARGTEVHAMGQLLVAGIPIIEVTDELRGAAEAYARLCDRLRIQPRLVERPIINRRHGYAGTFDLAAGIDIDDWLIDLKTGKGIYPDVALQLAAYNNAEHYLDDDDQEHEWAPAARCGVIHIGIDSAELIPVEAGPEQFRNFLYVKQVAGWVTDIAPTLIGTPIDPAPPRLEAVQ